MMVIISVITATLSLLNYFLWINENLSNLLQIISIIGQVLLIIVTIASLIGHFNAGKKKQSSKILSLPFFVILVSLLGNISVLTLFILKMAGIVQLL